MKFTYVNISSTVNSQMTKISQESIGTMSMQLVVCVTVRLCEAEWPLGSISYLQMSVAHAQYGTFLSPPSPSYTLTLHTK
jgi:hypothetical protein